MPPAVPATPDATDRQLLVFLEEEVAPTLARARRTRLLHAVNLAVRAHDPRRLASLPERSRRELLATVEHRLGSGRVGPSPGVVVRLVSALSPMVASDAGLGRLLATPAR